MIPIRLDVLVKGKIFRIVYFKTLFSTSSITIDSESLETNLISNDSAICTKAISSGDDAW